MSEVERQVRVTLPVDQDGFLQRSCPHCELLFGVDANKYEQARVVNLRCPRCMFVEPFGQYTTEAQAAFAHAHALDELNQMAEQLINDALGDLFSGLKSSKHVKVSGSMGRVSLPGTAVPDGIVDVPMNTERCPECDFGFKTQDPDSKACPICR